MAFNIEFSSTNFILYFSRLFFVILLMDYLIHHDLESSLLEVLKVRVLNILYVVVMDTSVESQYVVESIFLKTPSKC